MENQVKRKNYFIFVRDSLHEQVFPFDSLYQGVLLAVYSIFCFFIPFLIGEPQLLVGTAVNALLILSALELQGWRLLPVITFPSIGALSRGIVFGPFTPYLLMLIPFIWVGNAILVLSFKLLMLKMKKNFAITLAAGAVGKSVFLFSSAFLLYSLSLIPTIFLTAMGFFQFATALIGGAVAYAVFKAKVLNWNTLKGLQ
ncbi:hypothetical protein HY991_06165 [Candidatus Micrarchaeota archaeon]|nr:hypothetical protein [Candidatus Micrarchaeota archaeon]